MDVKIKTAALVFDYCVRALITQGEKILIDCVNNAAYYHLPGGHVALGETSQVALLREICEETGLGVTLDQLVVVQEQFYQKPDAAHHAIIFYYTAHPQNAVKTENTVWLEQGNTKMTKHALRWVTCDELQQIDLRPKSIKNLILKNELHQLKHIVDQGKNS